MFQLGTDGDPSSTPQQPMATGVLVTPDRDGFARGSDHLSRGLTSVAPIPNHFSRTHLYFIAARACAIKRRNSIEAGGILLPKAIEFRKAIELAVENVIKHGDTDIFPFPFENYAFFDTKKEIVDLVVTYNENFDEYLRDFPPQNVNSLTPVGYYGFRWASQIDPIWNLYFLSCVISVSEDIEAARIPISDNVVFSYRYKSEISSGDLFDRTIGWTQFIESSILEAENHEYVVSCDISEFYPRLGHHRLENALQHVGDDHDVPKRIMTFLSNFSNTRSFGLPIGGPASRILSEITINQIERLLYHKGIKFKRFADDYHIFASSREDAYNKLVFISEKLFENQGLSIQKSKTRIMTSAEFKATNPLSIEQNEENAERDGEKAAETHMRTALMRFSLNFDPYSPTAEKDYHDLKSEIKRFDILGMLKSELSKSRVHTALTRKIIAAIRHLEGKLREEAVLSILKNKEILYPIFSSVLMLLENVFDTLSDDVKSEIIVTLREMINKDSHILRVDSHLCFAIRVISHSNSTENQSLLQQLYERRTSPIVRRDIILVIARWKEWYWLSDLRNKFRVLSGPERRAFIVASYVLKEEGKHWRDHTKKEFDPFELYIKDWVAAKASSPKWRIPL